MPNRLSAQAHPDNEHLANLYRLQVRELEDYALFLANPDGRIITWNIGVERTFGYREEEWVGQDIDIIFTEDDCAAGIPRTEMQTAAEQGRCVDVRWHKRKDGTHVFMTGVLKGLRDEHGTLIGYSKIFLDDTARKRLEDALTQSNADLQQFAFVASHDLQEPLRTIISFSQLLQRRHKEELSEGASALVQSIVEAGQRMDAMIRDLLDYSSLENGKDKTATSVHLDEDFESALALLRSRVEETGAVVTHDPLPNVQAERGQMVRLFQNLIGNALKFRNREVPPRVHVSAEQRENDWIIRVEDNGIGFPPEKAEHIFAPFKRLHGGDYPGSGIGLAACKRIVERYGGRIGAESQPGKGSTFWFTIPAELTIERFGHQETQPSV